MTQLEEAVRASLKGDWLKAISVNLSILETNPKDIETLNRLGFAYIANGNPKKAKTMYNQVLELDNGNPIALKNIKKISEMGKKKGITSFQIENTTFLEEVGKTKIITLINPASTKILRGLSIGQPLEICIKRLKIFILGEKEEFLGMLPDNISRRLIKFMEGGNKYAAYIKSVDNKDITIFMKETKRAQKFANQPSFVFLDNQKQSLSSFKKSKNYEPDSSDEETSEE